MQAQAQVQGDGQAVTLEVRGLPADWRGKALTLLPLTPGVLRHAAALMLFPGGSAHRRGGVLAATSSRGPSSMRCTQSLTKLRTTWASVAHSASLNRVF